MTLALLSIFESTVRCGVVTQRPEGGPAGTAEEFFSVVAYFYLRHLNLTGARQGDMRPSETTDHGHGIRLGDER